MVLKSKKMLFLFVVYAMLPVIDMQACLTTFINDKGVRVIIYDKNDKSIIPVQKNEKRRFGNQHKRAYFAIYVQQPKVQTFSRAFVCKQNECGSNGNVQLKFSDIENGSAATELFTIYKSKPYSSMVDEVSLIQKKNCRACSAE